MGERGREVTCPLRGAATASPDAPAIVGAGETLTYAGLDRRVSAAARRLEAAGLGSGVRVALYLPKDERYIVLVLALIRAGAVACPLSTRVPPAGIGALLERAGCRALVSDDEDTLDAAGEGVEKLCPAELLAEEPEPGRRSGRSIILLDRPATLVFTSGSTGTPKAAVHTFGNHYFNALGSNRNIALGPGDRWMLSLPLYHVGGISIIFKCLLSGAAIALPRERAPLGHEMSRLGVTHASLVSTQLLRLLREESPALGGLKAILLGASAMPASLLAESVERGLPVHTSYGLTEMASQVTTTSGASPAELRTSGRILPYREVSISGEGEVLVRGETLFAGYVEGDRVDRPLDRDGWFHTKDLGRLDADGYLHVWGRQDNLFVSGGENIQPEEIEGALCRLEGVEQAVVVPVPDEEFGERPAAFVRTSSGDVSPESLASALGESLPRFKVPVAFYGWPSDVPEGMKVDRRRFRELARHR